MRKLLPDRCGDHLSPETDLVGHNIIGFDLPVLQRHFLRWLGDDANRLTRNLCWDTSLAEKGIGAQVLPEDGELWLDYLNRLLNVRACGVRWALDYCVNRFPAMADRLRTLGRQDPLYRVLAAHELYIWHRWIAEFAQRTAEGARPASAFVGGARTDHASRSRWIGRMDRRDPTPFLHPSPEDLAS
jgi:hypothetical protein